MFLFSCRDRGNFNNETIYRSWNYRIRVLPNHALCNSWEHGPRCKPSRIQETTMRRIRDSRLPIDRRTFTNIFNDTETLSLCMIQCTRNADCWAFNHHPRSATCILLSNCNMVPVREIRRPPDGGWRWVRTDSPQSRDDVISLAGMTVRYVSRLFHDGLYLPGWYHPATDTSFRAVSPEDKYSLLMHRIKIKSPAIVLMEWIKRFCGWIYHFSISLTLVVLLRQKGPTGYWRYYHSRCCRPPWLKCHWSVFPRAQLTITQHWFRQWLGAE